ncbi:MAG: DUF2853 family protein [Acidimicrobiales bacterium]
MGKFDDAVASAKAQMKQQKIPCNDALLEAVAKSLGPSLYKADARLVATSQKSELATIRKNFLIKKLGCKDDAKLDKAMDKAIAKIGPSNRHKLRSVFYYVLVKEMKKESVFV